MKAPLHRCAATGCSRQVPSHLLMCIDHWRLVPAPLRREVVSAWTWRQRSAQAPGGASVDAVRAHQAAVEKAVAAVATKQTNKQARRAAVEGDLFAATPDTSQREDGIQHNQRPA